MKRMMLGAAVVILAIGPAAGAPAEDAGNTCLKTYLIDRTDVRDERTIVFHMKGGKAWVNTLVSPCPGLRFNGFEYVVRGPDEICSNLQSIRVLKTGSVCMLGAFTPAEVKPAPGEAPQPGH